MSHQRDLPVLPPFVRPSSLVFRYEYSLVLTTTFSFSDRDLARHDADFRGYGPGASYGLLANVYMVLDKSWCLARKIELVGGHLHSTITILMLLTFMIIHLFQFRSASVVLSPLGVLILACYWPKVTSDPICTLLACLQNSVVDSLASLVSACLTSPLKF